jgi:hypothetical protein
LAAIVRQRRRLDKELKEPAGAIVG